MKRTAKRNVGVSVKPSGPDELDEPYQPRLPAMIHADLRAMAELYLADDLEWWKAFRPEVWS